MIRTSSLVALALASAAMFAPEGLGGAPTQELEGMSSTTAFHVHKEGFEGAIELSATGRITTPINELPEWAHGLAAAYMFERSKWYEDRVGPLAAEHIAKNVLSMDDLSWVGFDHDGKEVEHPASSEFRMATLAELVGVKYNANGSAEIEGAIAEYAISRDNVMEEMPHQDQGEGFSEQTKTGTQG